jgi:hypothetical protein
MPIVLKSESLNLLESSGVVQACKGIAKKNMVTKHALQQLNYTLNLQYSHMARNHNLIVHLQHIERRILDPCVSGVWLPRYSVSRFVDGGDMF